MRNNITKQCENLLREVHADLAMLKEAISWLKKAVLGIYGGLGLFIIQQVMAELLSKR